MGKSFMDEIKCPSQWIALNEAAMCFKLVGINIAEVSSMDLRTRSLGGNWNQISEKQVAVASEIIKEIQKRIQFLLDVGLII